MSDQENQARVKYTVEGHVAIISLDNVAKKNAITPELLEQMAQHLTTADRDDNVWVAVLAPEGEHTTAGLDMPKFFGPTATARELPDDWVDPFALKRRFRKPRFCQMESRRGIAPLGGAHFRYLTRAGWGNAMYHLFLCDEFDAQRALDIGFVQEVHPFGKHRERAIEIAHLICKNAPIGIQVTKEAALTYIEAGERAAIDYIPKVKDRVFKSEDFKEGLKSFAERRAANFQGR
jgi:enoyl-CoA hydratase